MTRYREFSSNRLEQRTSLPILPWSPFHHPPANVTDEKREEEVDVESYAKPFISYISENPTVFHTIHYFAKQLESHGFTKLSERKSWVGVVSNGGKYFFERNGSSLIAFVVGESYQRGNGAAIIASHSDVLTTKLKPISSLPTKAGYVQLGVAPYAGGLNDTWWDRDLGIGGRVLVKNSETGKIESKLVKLDWPIARIPTLAPHFGSISNISNANLETRLVPIIGLDDADDHGEQADAKGELGLLAGGGECFTARQPQRLVKAIAGELGIEDCKAQETCSLQGNNKLTSILSRQHHPELGAPALRHSTRAARRHRQRIHLRRPHRRPALFLRRH